MANDVDVLVVGAGPTGLAHALWLARAGVKLRIIDKVAEPGTTSRAFAPMATSVGPTPTQTSKASRDIAGADPRYFRRTA